MSHESFTAEVSKQDKNLLDGEEKKGIVGQRTSRAKASSCESARRVEGNGQWPGVALGKAHIGKGVWA